MEPEQSSQNEQIPEQEHKLGPLKKVTPLSKYLAMALFIALPFIGGWIGYTMMPEKVVEVERVVVKEVVRETKPSLGLDETKEGSEEEELSICGGDFYTGLTRSVGDTSDWVESTGTYNLYFKTRHPSSVTIERKILENDEHIFTISDSETSLSASVYVTELETEVFKFGGGNLPIYTYELHSNRIWANGYGQANQQCPVSDQYYTKKGNLIFVTSDGDVGAFWKTYNLILKPSPEAYAAYDCNRPLAVTIRYSGDANDPSYDQAAYQKFGDMIEQIVQEMEIMPVCKG